MMLVSVAVVSVLAATCSDIIVSPGGCESGTELASTEQVVACMPSLCAKFDTWGKASYADPNMMMVGYGYNATCGPMARAGDTGYALCVRTAPPPAPTNNCSQFTISTSGCMTGMVLADAGFVDQCMPNICKAMDVWAQAKYAVPKMMVLGSGYEATCGARPTDSETGDAICMKSKNNCSRGVVVSTGGCGSGSEIASADFVEECTAEVCKAMDVWAKAKYADPKMMVVGSGYDLCGPKLKDTELGDTVCVRSS